jgi:hypothetical protein
MLKTVFVDAARAELERGATTPTQSALSLLSGVHRKDVRALDQEGAAPRPPRRPPLASLVFTRWLSDRRYRLADGAPRPLPRTGMRRSFETLCRELSHDVHPRSVLDELLRLGLVALDGERVVVVATSFVPSERLDELTALFSANAADHLAAAVNNLTLPGPPFLEQSIYADGLAPGSDRSTCCTRSPARPGRSRSTASSGRRAGVSNTTSNLTAIGACASAPISTASRCPSWAPLPRRLRPRSSGAGAAGARHDPIPVLASPGLGQA